MFDFESVSVSSFEAASLAAILTEKSADGWDVVTIVPAGSDVVAYLRRSANSDSGADDISGTPTASITDGTSNTIVLDEGSADSAADLLTPSPDTTEAAEAAVATPATGTSGMGASGTGTDAGATGWGAGSDTGSAASTTSGGWSGGGTESSSGWSGSAQQTATSTAPAVPAGWYADPAGRFELRYWDGTAWTEHVSRAGQQYTDPPVA